MVDAAALAKGIEAEGRVSVYGIHFDTDKADIKPESRPALEEIAKLLKARPNLRIFVVGHTDMTGGLEHNRTLSDVRARAVVKALIDTYGIAANRLEGYGVVAARAGCRKRERTGQEQEPQGRAGGALSLEWAARTHAGVRSECFGALITRLG